MAAASPAPGSRALCLPVGGSGPSATSGSHQQLLQQQSPPSFRSAASCQEKGLPFLPNIACPPPPTLKPTTAFDMGGPLAPVLTSAFTLSMPLPICFPSSRNSFVSF
ncbi:hypothetical protein PAL_GLEAN10005671 [Pteropus alecto]|uniref:Uncharacterized protein n=1 Tax=Pteropus alecto TaxID=9402 RepID=L5KXA3_PTEAL|nr:hypothetical protein PAL_GLEAN10005671 [Pteropus alecto]